MSRWYLAALLLAGVVALANGGVGAQPFAPRAEAAAYAAPLPQLRPVRMTLLHSLPTAPFYVGIERGYFEAAGVDLQFESVQVSADALAQLGTGSYEAALLTVGAAVLNSVARGVEVKIVAGFDGMPPAGPGGNPFLVRKALYDSGVTDAAGLRGRKVASNGSGVFAQYAVDQAMRTAGMTIDDVDYVQIPFPDIPVAFGNSAIDAAFVAQPAAQVAITQGTAVQILPEFMRGAQQTVILGGPSLLREPAVAEAYLYAYLRGVRAIQAEGWTPEIAALVEKYTRVPAAVVQQIGLPYWDPEGRVNWDSLLDQQRFYLDRGATTYREPLDLPRVLSADEPRRAAVAALGR